MKRLVLIVVALAVVGGLAYGVFLFMNKKFPSISASSPNPSQSSKTISQNASGTEAGAMIPGDATLSVRTYMPPDMASSADPNDPAIKNAFIFHPFYAVTSTPKTQTTSSVPVSSKPKDLSVSNGSADFDGDGLTNDQEAKYGTDPKNADTDGDGLTDGEEVLTYHTNPLNPDTDGDGLTDGQEVHTYHTDPLKADTDGDGYSDGQEVKTGYNPLGPGKLSGH